MTLNDDTSSCALIQKVDRQINPSHQTSRSKPFVNPVRPGAYPDASCVHPLCTLCNASTIILLTVQIFSVVIFFFFSSFLVLAWGRGAGDFFFFFCMRWFGVCCTLPSYLPTGMSCMYVHVRMYIHTYVHTYVLFTYCTPHVQ